MTLYALAIYFELPYSHITFVVDHIINYATNHLQAKFHKCIHCYFNFKKARWCNCLNILQTHRIESLMFEIVAQWDSTLENIEQTAQANNQSAKWVMSAARLNQHAIYQCYAMHMQKLADEILQDRIRPASIKDTIRRTFQFDNGPLWDSPHNIQQINATQDAYTARD